MVKVSIIVPVHNAEKYLDKCVSSLLNQTLQEIEIILVDDCSSDTCPDLIRQYAGRHPGKVKAILLEENIRQGGARNRGLDIAQGEYIAFVDSDDWVEPDMCDVLYNLSNGADMVGSNYYIDTDERSKMAAFFYESSADFTIHQKQSFIIGCGYFVGRIYRRAFLDENKLRFPENTFYEDAWFNFMTAIYGKSIVKTDKAFYHYYQSANSTVRNRNNPRQYERIMIPERILADSKARGIYAEFKELIDLKYITMHMSNVRNTCLAQFDEPDWRKIDDIRRLVRSNCGDYKKRDFYKTQSTELKTYFQLAMWSPQMTVFLYKHGIDRWIELWGVFLRKFNLGK